MFDDQSADLASSAPANVGTPPAGAMPLDAESARRQAEAEARRAQALAKLGGAAVNPDGSPAGVADVSYRSQLPVANSTVDGQLPIQSAPVPPLDQPSIAGSSSIQPSAQSAVSISPAVTSAPAPASQTVPPPAAVAPPLTSRDPFSQLAREAANPIQIQPETALSDEEMADMFRRETLSPMQRILMFVVIIIIVGLFVGGGIWVYTMLDPFATQVNTDKISNTEQGTNTQIEETSVVPLRELDSDADGVLDINEAKYGTDPKNPDTDGDGYTDGSEIQGGYDPLNPTD